MLSILLVLVYAYFYIIISLFYYIKTQALLSVTAPCDDGLCLSLYYHEEDMTERAIRYRNCISPHCLSLCVLTSLPLHCTLVLNHSIIIGVSNCE